ncbi:MAG: PAS domain S-box protein [Treponema sp.]|jgi:PAS domain S-box-containing protein|nr:PAS domain S-box protein [Treponema sp.]
MRDFIKRALKKLNKMTGEQVEALLFSAAEEIDRLETVLDSLNDGIMVLDSNHALVMANKYAERYLPSSHHEQENVPIWSIARDERVREFLEQSLTRGDRVEEREFEVEIKDKQRVLSISVLPLVREHKVSGSLIYMEDITEKRVKEAQLRRAENLASLTTLAAGVAHEIKNPLGSLSIHVQLIQKAVAAKQLKMLDKYINTINEEISRLNQIVVDFLFAVRPMDMMFVEGDLNAVIADLIEFVRYELDEAKISCVLELQQDLPFIKFDERFIKQALLNLIKNAIAAMPGGGALTIKTKGADTEIQISVQDTGVGISEENLPKIFEPYFTTKPTGSGLGLTLVFKIIREHQGDMAVTSREGKGANFIITLPVPQKETRLLEFENGEDPGRGA